MRLDTLDVCLDTRDLRLQGLDPLVELRDRYRVEVLLAQCDERVVRLARKELFEVHGVNC